MNSLKRRDTLQRGAPGSSTERPLEIPYGIRWLVPDGERFVNFDIINDNDAQLDYWRRFGHIYAVGIPTKKWRLVVVSDPELLDEVADNEEQFGKRVEDINFFEQLEGSRGGGIAVMSDGDNYDRIRRVMLPWYAPSHQKTQFVRMKELARQMTATWSAMPAGTTLDAREWMQRYALEVSGRGACNYDFGLMGLDGPTTPFGQAVTGATKESIARIAEPRPGSMLLAGPAKRARNKSFRKQQKVLFATAEALVRGRLNTCPLGRQTDLLTRLVTEPDPATGKHLDTATVRDQVLMHLSNGFNGPSIIGAWLAYLLATHPEVEEKLIAEIDGITGGDPGYDFQYEDLMALPYITQVIKETLRIYPPMPVTIRRSKKEGMLGRYRVRKDDIILVGTLAAQRDPRYWGPHADVFDPDQFAMDKVIGRPSHAFIPFSVGQRQCIAQEVTFMMLRVALFEIYSKFRLRLPPGAVVVKNTVATTKPVAVPVLLEPRETRRAEVERTASAVAAGYGEGATLTADGADWDRPSEIPDSSDYRDIVVAYGSNFGSCRSLAERFAERSRVYGFRDQVVPLNELVGMAPRTKPWLLVIMTSTYTGNPPSNAVAFKTWLDRTGTDSETWRECRYLVWGLGNTQWNAFLAFPRYVQQKLAELGATPLGPLAFGDVGSPVADAAYEAWNERTWPALIELAGARPSEAAAERFAAVRSVETAMTTADSTSAMAMSLDGQVVVPQVMSNSVDIATFAADVVAARELQAAESPRRTRHLELSLPAGTEYSAGDHLGVCPKNDEAAVEMLARRLGVPLDGVFAVPATMQVHAVPRGVPLKVRNVLESLVDITGRPSVDLLQLLLSKAAAPDERAKLGQILEVIKNPNGPATPLRSVVDAGGYDVVELLTEFSSCTVNLFEFLQVAQALRPRYYSISSSPNVHGKTTAHITVGRNDAEVLGRPGRNCPAACSRYLHNLRVGDQLQVFIDRAADAQSAGFHLQDDVRRPMIFVSAGTGFAPMRAFLWERMAMKRRGVELGTAALFNGIRNTHLDHIYREEIEAFAKNGVLDFVHVATSRQATEKHRYVQDQIVAQGALVWALIRQGAYVYVCGSSAMRADVRSAFVTVVAAFGGVTREQAAEYVARMEAEQRYRTDVWG
ncbi:MAG TPA: cytochrome P450 [Tepidiformaceae bacterium]|nr:cytochrome P450 [Tepidiformaceae bacterium]